jgi:hypothetical protein
MATREEHLARIREQSRRINELKSALEAAFTERGDEFLAAVEDDPDVQITELARAAGGITGPAVSQQIEKARARRAKQQAAPEPTGTTA